MCLTFLVPMKLKETDYALLTGLMKRAEAADMSLYAFAIHTGNAYAIKVTDVWRAMSDGDYCQFVFTRHFKRRRHLYVRLVAQRR